MKFLICLTVSSEYYYIIYCIVHITYNNYIHYIYWTLLDSVSQMFKIFALEETKWRVHSYFYTR